MTKDLAFAVLPAFCGDHQLRQPVALRALMLLDKTAWLAAVWPTVNPGTQESSHCSLTWDQALNEQPWWVVSGSVRTLGVGQRARPCIKGPAR